MGKTKGVKYSSYLDDLGELRLEKFCTEFNCSKAKAISYLLELWENGTIKNKLATVSQEVQSELEKKLATYVESKFYEEFVVVNEQFDELKQQIDLIQEQLTMINNHKLPTKENH